MPSIKQGLRPNTVKIDNLVYVNSTTSEITEASDVESLQAKSFQTDNYELTDALLGRLTNLDYQPDVLAEQHDNTLSPSLTDGARYILSNVTSLNAGFGTINKYMDGTAATLANGMIVQYSSATTDFRIDYDVVSRGPGALCWDRAYNDFKKWDGSTWSASTGGAVLSSTTLGLPADGTYSDGLLSLTATTSGAEAVASFNEVLKYLAPSQGYTLPAMATFAGQPTTYSTPKLVGSSATPLTGSSYETSDTNGGARSDLVQSGNFTLVTPQIADKNGVVQVGFQMADQGTLSVFVNGTQIDTVNLGTSFIEANRATGQTGLPWVGAASKLKVTAVRPTNGFPYWQDGLAQIVLATADLRIGYNYIVLQHVVSGATQASYTQKYWYSPVMAAPVASSLTLGAFGSTTVKNLSGVQYLSAGSLAAGVSVNSPYGTSYNPTGLNFTANVLSGASVATPTPTIVSGAVTNVPWAISGQTLSILGNQRVIIGGQVSVNATPLNNYGSNGTAATPATIPNILIDSYSADASNALTHTFESENNRVTSNATFNSTAVVANWDSTQSIGNAGAAGYSDGLICYNGALRYPSQNFTGITVPAAGPDYSTATGRRYYIAIFNSGSTSYQNFHMQLVGLTAGLLSTVAAGTGITLEMALPTQTSSNGQASHFEFKDCMVAYTTDNAIGCQQGVVPSGSNPTVYFTAGTKGTANSGYKVLVRIGYPQGSSAALTSLVFNWN